MRRGFVAIAVAGAALVASGVVPAGSAAAAPVGPRGSLASPTSAPTSQIVPRELVVVFRDGVGPGVARDLHRAAGTDREARAPELGIDVVRVPAGRSVAASMQRYAADRRVLSVEPNVRRFPTLVPGDGLFRHQWGMRNTGQNHLASHGGRHRGRSGADVDATTAWNTTAGSNGVVVAVLDGGVDIDHPDLAASMWTNPGETPNDGVDNDDNGYIDDVNGWDFENDDRNPTPPRGDSHGTHVAGVVAAPHDGDGVAGMCPDCRVMALRFGFTIAEEVRAIDYAVANGADVINMSFGGNVWSAAERRAIDEAGDAGVLVVASAGNASLDNDIAAFLSSRDSAPSFPASYGLPEILTVAASTDRDAYGYSSLCDRRGIPIWVCAFTSWGRVSVDVAAPGVDVVSTVNVGRGPGGDDHDTWDGTSMAAPAVAGIAGLVRSQFPGLGPVEVKNAIMNGVDEPRALRLWTYHHRDLPIGAGPHRGRFTRTQGRVNAVGALAADTSNATRRSDGTIAGSRRLRRIAEGRVSWPADANDVYSKRLRGGTRYEIRLDGPAGSDLDLFVWNPGTVDLWQFDAGCFHVKGRCRALRASSSSPEADERVSFRVPRAGVYHVHVSGWYSGGRYRLVLRRV